MKEKEEQRYGRDKSTIVDKSYLESGEFRKKFDMISDSQELNRLLYQLAKKMLLHRSGTKYEDMYWIDPETIEVIASETNSKLLSKIVYSEKTKKAIRGREGLITIHSHPGSFPPSVEDLNSNQIHSYGTGIVITHKCDVYLYGSEDYINPLYYSLKLENMLALGYNEIEAQVQTLNYFKERMNVYIKEVTIDDV